MGKKRNVYRVLVGKPEGKSPLEDLYLDGRIILKLERRGEGFDWISLAQV
jgi:hypothetical protein